MGEGGAEWKPRHLCLGRTSTDRSAIAECPRCYQKWRVFASQEPTKYQPQYSVQIIESDRSEEQIGKEERLIDNLKSTIELERRFTISKEWSKLYAIEIEKLQANEKAVSAGLNIYLSDL
jgi:hypothetical protein